jgi:hypothetical protein
MLVQALRLKPWQHATSADLAADVEAILHAIPNATQGPMPVLFERRRIKVYLPPDRLRMLGIFHCRPSDHDMSVLLYSKCTWNLTDDQITLRQDDKPHGVVVYVRDDGHDPDPFSDDDPAPTVDKRRIVYIYWDKE